MATSDGVAVGVRVGVTVRVAVGGAGVKVMVGVRVGPAVGVGPVTATLFETVTQVGRETNGGGTSLNRLSRTVTFVPLSLGKRGEYQRGPPHFSI